jgi:hypothetical protein
MGDALEIRDDEGRVVVRFVDGAAEVFAPSGDLTFSAPKGAVRLRSATDVELTAGRDLVHRAERHASVEATRLRFGARETELESADLQVSAERSRFTSGVAQLVARHIQTSADTLVTRVERCELTAERIVERSRDTLREVSDLLQTKSGRVRSFVEGVYAMYTDRTVMVSEQDTSIDGDKVLLG